MPEVGLERDHADAFDQAVALDPLGDQVGHRAHLQVVLPAQSGQVVDAGHGAVVVHDLDAQGDAFEAGHLAQVDHALGVSGADEYAAGAGADGLDMPGPGQVGRA